MFDPGSSAGGTISSSEHDLETRAALRFGSRFVDRQIHCENCQPSQRTGLKRVLSHRLETTST